MKRLMAGVCCLLVFAAGSACADELKDASDRLQPLTERITKIGAGKSADYLKSQLAAAQETLGAVKAAIAAKNGPVALQKTELVDLQLTIAEAKAAEMEADEQLVLRRAELKKFEAQFDQLLQTGGK
ncbi:MAG: hypothetical protein OEL57_00360 [Trichlorobacter sp.]|uniref:hypothetical protein n=1 Tax=Trichlorobacter sp. TaxID=2911007 RepID=UPI00256D0E8F|nr:hypothetical protein [Trichlorobacter sp.]MDK9716341.1 hypothetical protein [Trichlorobacter sp.]